MKSLEQLTTKEARALNGLLFDLDDTALDEGRLAERTYSTLFSLRETGLRLIALTGRPASWGEVIARMWPVEAAIAENGAIAFRRDGKRLLRLDTLPAARREDCRYRLAQLIEETRKALPNLYPADDVEGRISDYTFDIGEHERPEESTIREAQALAHAHGAKTTRSSVHLHFTFDRTDKATGALAFLRSQGEDTTTARQSYAFIGDSQNDASAFAAFHTSCGVRNLSGSFSLPPRFRTKNAASDGFYEFSQRLIQLRMP
jgi:HAD superfamily hydrolase (TIGR01484 family)